MEETRQRTLYSGLYLPSAGSSLVLAWLLRLLGSRRCFSSVAVSSVMQILPVRMRVCSNGVFPFRFVMASAYMPLWSTQRTSPFWTSREDLMIWISMAVRLSAGQPAVSLCK